jgi:hypothetical protein
MPRTCSGKRYCRREPAASEAPPLLDLLERHPILFAQEVLARLAPADRASLAGVGLVWRDAVYLSSIFPDGLPRAETPRRRGAPVRVFKLMEFVGSVERLAWARDNGCPWTAKTFALAAEEGSLKVLQWAREHGCPWVRPAIIHVIWSV